MGFLVKNSPAYMTGLSDSGKVNQELVHAVDAKKAVHGIIMVRSNGTNPAADGRYRKMQVLADMPAVLVEFPVARLAGPPGHPVRDGDPEEDHPAPHDELLLKTGFGNSDVQRRVRVEPLETVGQGEVPVQPRSSPSISLMSRYVSSAWRAPADGTVRRVA